MNLTDATLVSRLWFPGHIERLLLAGWCLSGRTTVDFVFNR